MVDFGNTLKTLRLYNKMTQAQLAQKLGLTKSVIRHTKMDFVFRLMIF